MSALQVRSLHKRFGGTLAVHDVSVAVAPGELVALVGPSGCGKSTLLRLVAGLHHADAGTIEVGGRLVDGGARVRLAPEHRAVGLVFQEHALFPHLRVADNVGFGLRRHPERRRRAAELLELVGLAEHADRFPHELSGGERQRVALARALAPDPQLLLLDEPFASLDPNLRARLRADVLHILRAAGTAAVLVTHDQAEALAAGGRVAVMHRGAIVQDATPGEVFHAPANRFVAAFMGEADFLDAADLGAMGAAPGAAVGGSGGAGEPGDGALFMVRPDDIALTADDRGAATVVDAEFRGSTWCYTVELGSGRRVRALRSHLEPLALGGAVHVGLVPGHRPVRLADEPAPTADA